MILYVHIQYTCQTQTPANTGKDSSLATLLGVLLLESVGPRFSKPITIETELELTGTSPGVFNLDFGLWFSDFYGLRMLKVTNWNTHYDKDS